ncbi:DedA family protein [Vacuolonema iberomarrocanum]|uniref:DedA family protein n=1 Tax=Vacuolonema iberomarrocanum TaxID=3454632 RepID=UPI0019FE6A06|nr:DedA family protein [filamentous cyanobacterium LEGE 07170]
MAEWITDIMESLGYAGIAFLMFLENLFPPIPSEVIMPLAGFTVAQGDMAFIPAIAAGVFGTVLGALPWYFAGAYFGEKRLMRWADRYGKWLTLSSRELEKAIAWFNQYGKAAVFLCRLVPGVRTLISLPAGLARMNMAVFLVYSTLGTIIWTTLLTIAGYWLGAEYERIETYLGPISKVALGLILVSFVGWVWWRHQHRPSDEPPP